MVTYPNGGKSYFHVSKDICVILDENFMSEEQLAREYFVSTGTVTNWIKKGKIVPSVTYPFGSRKIHLFSPESVEKYRKELNLKVHNSETIKDDFFSFLEERDYSLSYKMPFMLGLISHVNTEGDADIDDILTDYIAFYQDRLKRGLPVDRKSCPYLLTKGCHILDLGSGSGRDSKYFTEKGYDVIAVDPSPAMCKRTKEYAGVPTFLMRAEEMSFEKQFDAVWACASLLHVPREKQIIAMHRIYDSLHTGGILYCSWKYGDQDRIRDGRIFTDLNEEGLNTVLMGSPGLYLIETWVTSDVRPERNEQKWLNALIRKK